MYARVTVLVVAVALFAGAISPSHAQEPTAAGLWQKLDGDPKEPFSWFLIVERGGVFEGYIAKLFPRAELVVTSCFLCTDDRKDAPPLGLSFIRGMKRNGLRYEGGTLLDPRSGKIFGAILTLSPDNRRLSVRAILPGLFPSADYWYRLPESAFKQLNPAIIKISGSALSPQAK